MTSKQYKIAYDKLFNQLPKRKQLAVKEDSKKNNWSGILTDFVRGVIYNAEKEFDQNQLTMVDEVSPSNAEKGTKPSKKLKNKKI
jgi:hypothetical protein